MQFLRYKKFNSYALAKAWLLKYGPTCRIAIAGLYKRGNRSDDGLIQAFGYDRDLGAVREIWANADYRNVSNRWGRVLGTLDAGTPGELNTASQASAPYHGTEGNELGPWTSSTSLLVNSVADPAPAQYNGADFSTYALSISYFISVGYVYQDFAVTNGVDYIIEYWAKRTAGTTAQAAISNAATVTQAVTDDWVRYSHRVTTGSTTLRLEFHPSTAGSGTIVVDGVSVRPVAASGLEVAFASGENTLENGDDCQIWDVSSSSSHANNRTATRKGGNVVFDGAALTLAEGDLIHANGVCEFGDLLSEANGGLWVPQIDTFVYWSPTLGLMVEGAGAHAMAASGTDKTCLHVFWVSSPDGTTVPTVYEVDGEVLSLTHSGVANGACCGVGRLGEGTNEFVCASGLYLSTTWRQARILKTTVTSVASSGTDVGDPDGTTGKFTHSEHAVSTNVRTVSKYHSSGLSTDFTDYTTSGTGAGIGWSATYAPVKGVAVIVNNGGTGQIALGLKRLGAPWLA